ncbi:MAG: pilus assembly protein TadG-related protein [Chloroflexales bacterium]
MVTRRRRAEGQAIIFLALAFVVLVAFLGLALDGANAFGQRRRVSNAADAASLAATRMLVTVNINGGNGQTINDAIREFLVNNNGIDPTTSTWEASYVSRDDPDTVIAPVENDVAPPEGARGVRVELSFTFDTAFMSVMGQNTLTVGATSTSTYGALGTAIGQDLLPIGISDSALNTLMDKGEIRVDLRGKIMQDYSYLQPGDPLPSELNDVITDANFDYVTLSDTLPANLPNANGCNNPNVTENLSYWICNGTLTQLQIGRYMSVLNPNWGDVNSSLIHRILGPTARPTAVVPVYTQVPDGHGGVALQLAYFVGVDLNYSMNKSVLTMTLRNDYISAGSAIGEGSGVETGVWAVNLKR